MGSLIRVLLVTEKHEGLIEGVGELQCGSCLPAYAQPGMMVYHLVLCSTYYKCGCWDLTGSTNLDSFLLLITKSYLSHLQDLRHRIDKIRHPTLDIFSLLYRVLNVRHNRSLFSLIQRNKTTSADVIFRCASLIYLSSSRGFGEHLYRGSTDRNSQRLQMKYGGIGFSRVTTGSPDRSR